MTVFLIVLFIINIGLACMNLGRAINQNNIGYGVLVLINTAAAVVTGAVALSTMQ